MVKIETLEGTEHSSIKIEGEIDASSSIELDNALKEAMDYSKPILIDMSGLSYISSAGLGVFISYIDDLKAQELKLVLYNMQEPVVEIFDILGLMQILNVVNSEEEAKEAIA